MAMLPPKKKIQIFFLLFFLVCLCYYMILDTCLLISLEIICCLFIDMVENAGDDPSDRKPSVVDLKLPLRSKLP